MAQTHFQDPLVAKGPSEAQGSLEAWGPLVA